MNSRVCDGAAAAGRSQATVYPTVCRLIESRFGLSMERGTLPGSLEHFIKNKMTALGITDETVFANVLACASPSLMSELVDAVTVPYSWLFRDYEQLHDAVRALVDADFSRTRPQVWVPACASGEDAYSIAAIAGLLGKPIDLLATDINGRVLESAMLGSFSAWSARSVPECHAAQIALGDNGLRSFAAEVRECIKFANHNLIEAPPRSAHHHGGWDLILCRNVLIYFARSQAQRVLNQLKDALSPQGLLVLGASDIVLEIPGGLRTVDIRGRIAFKRCDPLLNGLSTNSHAKFNETKDLPLAWAQKSLAAGEVTLSSGPAAHAQAARRNDEPTGSSFREDADSGVEEMLEGMLRYLAGNLHEAAQSLREALFHCAQLWPAAYYLALCYEELGRGPEAKREYKRTADLIARKVELPHVPNHDFSFLEHDIRGLAERKAAGLSK